MGVGYQQDDDARPAVPRLECESSLQGLSVIDHSLSLDGHGPVAAGDHRIPGAPVARQGQWPLRRPAKGWRYAGVQAAEQPDLRQVPDRIAAWEGLKGDRETDCIGHAKEARRIHVPNAPAFGTAHLRARHIARLGHRLEAQTCAPPGEPDVGKELVNRNSGLPSCSIEGSLPCSHAGDPAPRPSPGDCWSPPRRFRGMPGSTTRVAPVASADPNAPRTLRARPEIASSATRIRQSRPSPAPCRISSDKLEDQLASSDVALVSRNPRGRTGWRDNRGHAR